MKVRDVVLLGIVVLGLAYLLKGRKIEVKPSFAPSYESLAYLLKGRKKEAPPMPVRASTDPVQEVMDKVKTIDTGQEVEETDTGNIILRNAIKSFQLSNAVIHAYTDPELSQVLPTNPTELKYALHPIFQERTIGDPVRPRDIRIPY